MEEPRRAGWAYVATPEQLGRWLREQRESLELTQEQLADELGITRQYLHEIESGKPSLYTSRLFSLLRLLGARLKVEGRNG
ncbi:helix-turn-helix transcriptional regulator [Cellulomonas marina]|uniref:DNA-binding transcriptional regulator, XRE-family HTH domain n=1 Tax=Cellulomonas marina TaxID=988821 RepID=A0A1I1A957_9CELL|nr:helix-turn-helix transcriptional regulator [Cellulomonas marina]GIG30416.1 hypothetical protein Cma02nite_30160 [Cellulomonas marina]SFB34539.1 DNA-binding transcriptional regulator, XRE-family HTH domain [Cellulomonas marina]